jgi:ribosome-binding factor A
MRRPERVADLLREEITQIVGFELSDPRLTMVTVTDVRVADNLRDAKVFVTVIGSEQEIKEALVALRKASPYIRKQVGFALSLRHTPELHFVRDTVEERGARVDELLLQIGQTSAASGDDHLPDGKDEDPISADEA